MKKIMFSDRFGLTDAVLSGQKTMTRRIMPRQPRIDDCLEWGVDDKGKAYVAMYGATWHCDIYPAYQIGEQVAIAQAYQTLRWPSLPGIDWKAITDEVTHSKGWSNKMFVKAEYMPHRIQITDIKFERLNDITEEDCRKEGIICVNFRQWLKQDLDDFSPQEYVDHDVWTLPIFRDALENGWGEQSKDDIASYTAKTAFIVLLAKLSHKSPSEVNALNPWLFAYEFKLIKD